MKIFVLTAKETHWSDDTMAFVMAKDAEQADAVMTCGSDSPWISVMHCQEIGTITIDGGKFLKYLFHNAGGYVIRSFK